MPNACQRDDGKMGRGWIGATRTRVLGLSPKTKSELAIEQLYAFIPARSPFDPLLYSALSHPDPLLLHCTLPCSAGTLLRVKSPQPRARRVLAGDPPGDGPEATHSIHRAICRQAVSAATAGEGAAQAGRAAATGKWVPRAHAAAPASSAVIAQASRQQG